MRRGGCLLVLLGLLAQSAHFHFHSHDTPDACHSPAGPPCHGHGGETPTIASSDECATCLVLAQVASSPPPAPAAAILPEVQSACPEPPVAQIPSPPAVDSRCRGPPASC